jgi:uncharacterized protein
MLDLLSQPWPWYVSGPLLGLAVPFLLYLGNKAFGLSENLRHICAAALPSRPEFFRYDWKKEIWSLTVVAGIMVGAFVAATLLTQGEIIVGISEATRADLAAIGVRDFTGLVPSDLFSWASLGTVQGLVLMIGGGFLVGFGTRYAGGCTSGHAISGLADLQFASLVAVIGFFAGGLLVTHLLLPLLL